MRIISGEFRRRVLAVPPDDKTTRPMPDRVKEAVFNLLRGHFEGALVFDAFAGVGTVGLEALSRGAERCVFVERDRMIASLLDQNIAALGVGDRADVAKGDALGAGALSRCPRGATLVFFDPPYALMREPARRDRVLEQMSRCIKRMAPEGFAILRTPWPLHGGEEDETLRRELGDADLTIAGAYGPETHEYGSMAIHLYSPVRAEASENEPEPEAGEPRIH